MQLKSVLMSGIGLFALATLQTAVSAPVRAQAEAQPDVQSPVGDIIVTAQKRSQKLQDVAGSISAIGSEQLALTGAKTVADLTSQSPGLVFGEKNGIAFITMRGVGLSIDTGVAEPNVAVHVDGVYIPRASMTTLTAEDLERVEVLRGPQGTLYGRNATGGAINLISKAPAKDWTGGAKLGYGNYETITSSAFVSGPLSDSTRIRISGSYQDRGKGYVRNTFTNDEFDTLNQFTVRAALQSDLTETLTADLSVLYQETEFYINQQLLHPLGANGMPVEPLIAGSVAPAEPRTVGSDFDGPSKRSTLSLRAGLTWDVSDDVQLKSITSYLDHKYRATLDADSTSAPFTEMNAIYPSESYSQEFNLNGVALEDKLNWLVGAYYFHEEYENQGTLPFRLGFPAVFPGEVIFSTQLLEKTKSLAAFADMTYSVTPGLRVYGGARYSHDVKDEVVNLSFTSPALGTLLSCSNTLRQEFNSFSPRIGIQADIADDVMTYAQYQKGFKSGGANSTDASCADTFEPEKLNSYEVGFKSRFLDNIVTLNASAFYYDYKGLQIFRYTPLGAQIDNADARIYGLEVETQIKPASIFQLDLGATLLDAKYKDFTTINPEDFLAGPQNVKGNRLDRAPRYVFTASPQIMLPVAFGGFDTFSMRADLRFSDEMFFSPTNSDFLRQKSYQTVDLSAALTSDQGLNIRAYVKNLTNEDIVSTAFFNTAQFTYQGTYAPPRTYGIEVGFEF